MRAYVYTEVRHRDYGSYPEMEFLDFKLTKDSSLSHYAIHRTQINAQKHRLKMPFKNSISALLLPLTGIGEEKPRQDRRSGEASQINGSKKDYLYSTGFYRNWHR